MVQTHFLEHLYVRYFPNTRKNKNPLIQKDWDSFDQEKKRSLAKDFVKEGIKKLSDNDLTAIDYFEAASYLDQDNFENWLDLATAFYNYGKEKNNKKALIFASKNLKIATNIKDSSFKAWWIWAKTLLYLGNLTEENHFYNDAKDKLQKAISLIDNCSKEELAQLYWDYSKCLSKIADITGEAIDVKKAIQAMKTSYSYQNKVVTDFWYDFGQVYFQMGLLINDKTVLLQACEYFKKSLTDNNSYVKGWIALTETYTQLYINTMDESFFNQANEGHTKIIKIIPNNSDIWLEWAQLLCESGKINKDEKKLRQSMDRCIIARKNNSTNPLIIAQWVESQSFLGAYSNRLDLIVEAENKMIELSEKFSELPEIWYAYGMCMQSYGLYYDDLDYDEIAIEKFQTGISLERSNAELWHALASSHSKIGKNTQDLDFLEKACKFYQQAMLIKPCCANLIYDYSATLLKLGELTDNESVLEKAAHYFENLLQNQKNIIINHPEWLYNYGLSLDLLGENNDYDEENFYAKAIESFQSVLLIDPDYPNIHFRLAVSFSHLAETTLEREHFEKAFNYFRLSIQQDEENEDSWLEWGLSLIAYANSMEEYFMKSNIYIEAEQKLLTAGKLGNQHAYYHLACLYSIMSKFNQSYMLLKQAKEQDVLPCVEELMQDEWLENMRSTELFTQFIQQLEDSHKLIDEI